MAKVILEPFKAFRKEASIIGRLLAGYGELEHEHTVFLGRLQRAKLAHVETPCLERGGNMFNFLMIALAMIGGIAVIALIAFIGVWFSEEKRKSFKSKNGLDSCSLGGKKLMGVNDNENLIAFQSDSWRDLKVYADEVERVELRINGRVLQCLEPQKSSKIEVVRKFAVDQQNLVIAGVDAERVSEQLASLTLVTYSSSLPLGHIHTFWKHTDNNLEPSGFADGFEYSQWWLRRIRSLIVGEKDQDVEEYFLGHG